MVVKKKTPRWAWWGNYVRFFWSKSCRLYDFKKWCFLNLQYRKMVGGLSKLFVAVILNNDQGV